MTPDIITREEFLVIGIRSVLDLYADDVDALWREKLLPRRAEMHGITPAYYSVFNLLESAGECRVEYVAGVAADSLEAIPLGMVSWVVPTATYAEVAASGLPGVAEACRELITEWLPDSGYQRTASPMFAYTEDARPDSPQALWKINIPIETPGSITQVRRWMNGEEGEG